MFVCFFVDERWNQIDLSKKYANLKGTWGFCELFDYISSLWSEGLRLCVRSSAINTGSKCWACSFGPVWNCGIRDTWKKSLKNRKSIINHQIVEVFRAFSGVLSHLFFFPHLDLSNHHVSTQTFQVNTLKKVFCPIPRCSMLLEYLPTKLRHFWGKCTCAYCSTTVRIWDSK